MNHNRDQMIPRQVQRSDGTVQTYWVKADHQRISTAAKITAIGMVPVAALGLSGCVQGDNDIDEAKPSVGNSQTATPVPTETAAAPIPGDLDGNGQLSEREKEILADKAPRDYTLPDGTVVQIDPSQPLPAPVAEIVQSGGSDVANQFQGGDAETVLQALYAFADQKQAETGRGVILVYTRPGVDDSGNGVTLYGTAASGASSPVKASTDQGAVMESAQSWAAGRDYDLFVVN